MDILVIIHESALNVVVPAGEHTGGCFLGSEPLLVERLGMSVRSIASHHLLALINPNALSLDQLQVSETRDQLVLNAELDLHGETRALLDDEWLRTKIREGILLAEIDDNSWTTLNLKSEFENDSLCSTTMFS